MTTDRVVMAGTYNHDETNQTMRVIAADLSDDAKEMDLEYVELVDPEMFLKNGFRNTWFGTTDEFFEQWTALEGQSCR